MLKGSRGGVGTTCWWRRGAVVALYCTRGEAYRSVLHTWRGISFCIVHVERHIILYCTRGEAYRYIAHMERHMVLCCTEGEGVGGWMGVIVLCCRQDGGGLLSEMYLFILLC